MGKMDGKGFIRTESYSLRLKPSGAKKVTEEFNSRMNAKVEYRRKNTIWVTVLLLKARELAQYLVGKRKTIEFSKPSYVGKRDDTDLLRKKIRNYSA
ncbi:hypothetical protein [Methanolobus sp. ZRKC5]|uniref:hypothetical protein n=1 Tax=unclassified Methanolobus TaxID=2629569 RepID=UPI00313D4D29